mmetsp:Transcript_69818/g.209721  ORF Transcript_69818/g.209721 Transcript_69818/m.209721 type:complete len:210 (-) Transcript_69818:596-1225(-)
MSGSRPGFCSGVPWRRPVRYAAACANVAARSGGCGSLERPSSSRRRATSTMPARTARQRPSRSSLVMHSTRLSSVCVSSLPAMFVLGDGLVTSLSTASKLASSLRAASSRALWPCCAAAPPAFTPPRPPSSLSTAFIASAAAALMSGSRPGFCSGALWIRPFRYSAICAHTSGCSGLGGSRSAVRRRTVSRSASSACAACCTGTRLSSS